MKTQLEMAHEWAMKHGNAETIGGRQNMIKYAWEYADAMQAEADKRELAKNKITKKTTQDEIDQLGIYPRKPINEFHPDWSQAPDGYDWFCVGKKTLKGYFCNIKPKIIFDKYWFVGEDSIEIENHGYTDDWRESLRKRPD